MVCQFEQPRNLDVAVLVDLWQPGKPAAEQLDSVELAVSFAATVVADLCRKGGSNLHLAAGDRPSQHVGGPASDALLQEMMQRLATAEAHPGDRLAELLEAALGQLDPGCEIILVGTRPVDLDDASRFAPLWADPARRAMLRRVRCIDTSSDRLAQYFQGE